MWPRLAWLPHAPVLRRTLGITMAVLRYTLLRALVLVVVGALAWLVGFRGFWLLLVAVFVSGVVSIFALRASRDQVSVTLDRRLATINQRIQQRAAAEDAWNDAHRNGDVAGNHEHAQTAEQVPSPEDGSRPS